jgi:hypothetical protein
MPNSAAPSKRPPSSNNCATCHGTDGKAETCFRAPAPRSPAGPAAQLQRLRAVNRRSMTDMGWSGTKAAYVRPLSRRARADYAHLVRSSLAARCARAGARRDNFVLNWESETLCAAVITRLAGDGRRIPGPHRRSTARRPDPRRQLFSITTAARRAVARRHSGRHRPVLINIETDGATRVEGVTPDPSPLHPLPKRPHRPECPPCPVRQRHRPTRLAHGRSQDRRHSGVALAGESSGRSVKTSPRSLRTRKRVLVKRTPSSERAWRLFFSCHPF